jgi:hypothetical protein
MVVGSMVSTGAWAVLKFYYVIQKPQVKLKICTFGKTLKPLSSITEMKVLGFTPSYAVHERGVLPGFQGNKCQIPVRLFNLPWQDK